MESGTICLFNNSQLTPIFAKVYKINETTVVFSELNYECKNIYSCKNQYTNQYIPKSKCTGKKFRIHKKLLVKCEDIENKTTDLVELDDVQYSVGIWDYKVVEYTKYH